ncbi:MAG: hypothetical protein NVS4B8_07810 [Herpetosiphon sp.]
MNTQMDNLQSETMTTRRIRRTPLSPLGKLTVAALVIIALIFGSIALTTGQPFTLVMFVVHLVIAAIVATGFRWLPALAALLCALLLSMGVRFIGDQLAHPVSAFTFGRNALTDALWIVGLLAGIGATIQNYRRPFAERTMPRGTFTALLALATLILGGTLTTAIQPRAAATGISPEAIAALPPFRMKEYSFEHKEIAAKVGETVVLQLVNSDSTTHYLDLDELNVHAQVAAGKTNVALFKPTAAGTYTYYCHPHGNKADGTGMVGRLIVTP